MKISLGGTLRMVEIKHICKTDCVRQVKLLPCKWHFWPPSGDCRHWAASSGFVMLPLSQHSGWRTWVCSQGQRPRSDWGWGCCWCGQSGDGRKTGIEDCVKWLGLLFSLDENFWPKETPYNPLPYFLKYGIFKSNQNHIPKNEQILWVIRTSLVTDGFVSCCSRSANADLISYLFLLFCLEAFLVFQEVSF